MASPYDVFGIPSSTGPAGGYDAEVRGRLAQMAARRAGGAAAAAPSVATAANPAPVATAVASATPSFGKALLTRAAPVVAPLAAAVSDVYDMGKNGVNTNNALSAGLNAGIAGISAVNPLAGLGLFAGKTLGDFASPVLSRLFTSPAEDAANAANRAAGVPASAVSTAAPAAPATITPNSAAAAEIIAGRGVPAPGTGAIINSRGVGSLLNTSGLPVAAVSAPAAPVRPAPPQLGEKGGIFSNLVPFVNKVSAQRFDTAYDTRDYNRAAKASATALKTEEVASGRMKAVADIIAAQARSAAAATSGVKETTDAAGRPGTLDLKTGVFRPATPPLTEENLQATMKANKLTRSQTLDKLVASGKITAAEAAAMGAVSGGVIKN